MSAGYSGTPLPQKLGIKAGHLLAVLEAPAQFADLLVPMPDNVTVVGGLPDQRLCDVIVLFATAQTGLVERFLAAAARLQPNGGLWVAWPKKASGVATDVTENAIRDMALAVGLVDNKVCAIDATWSGLRCVYRVKDRPKV